MTLKFKKDSDNDLLHRETTEFVLSCLALVAFICLMYLVLIAVCPST